MGVCFANVYCRKVCKQDLCWMRRDNAVLKDMNICMRLMNNVRSSAEEIVLIELIYVQKC